MGHFFKKSETKRTYPKQSICFSDSTSHYYFAQIHIRETYTGQVGKILFEK